MTSVTDVFEVINQDEEPEPFNIYIEGNETKFNY